MSIIALDPGKTVGWAGIANHIYSGQHSVDELWDFLEYQQPIESLVVERFHVRHMGVALDPVECIGVIKEWARQNKVIIHWQMPHQAKHFFTDARLREKGLYKKGKPHANDAVRHLLYYKKFTLRELS